MSLLISLTIIAVRNIGVVKNHIKNVKLRDCLPLFVIMAFGAVLRIRYTLHTDLDPYCWRYIQNAIAIKSLIGFSDIWNFSIGTSHYIPGYSVMISPFIRLGSLNLVSLLNVGFSVLTIGTVYPITYILTKNKVSSLLSAFMLAVSSLHVLYSGYESSYTCSVFIVTLEWFYFLLWLETKDDSAGYSFILLFIISLNVKKAENLVFLPLFLFTFIRRLRDDKLKTQIKKYFGWFLFILGISVLLWVPYFKNLIKTQPLIFKSSDLSAYGMFGVSNIIRHSIQMIKSYKGFPLFMVGGYVLACLINKENKRMNLILGWFLSSLLYYSYYANASATWSTQQVLIPIFIMSGVTISETIKLFFKKPASRWLVVILIIAIFSHKTYFSLKERGRYDSWIELKKELNVARENDCVVSLEARTSKFALEFLFPDKNWIFIDDIDYSLNWDSYCEGELYYFNPIPYGLKEEADIRKFSDIENLFRKQYRFEKMGTIEFYKLEKY